MHAIMHAFCLTHCEGVVQATDYKTKFEPLIKKGATLGLSHGFLLG
jgi:hypothetical protein